MTSNTILGRIIYYTKNPKTEITGNIPAAATATTTSELIKKLDTTLNLSLLDFHVNPCMEAISPLWAF